MNGCQKVNIEGGSSREIETYSCVPQGTLRLYSDFDINCNMSSVYLQIVY